jgi:NAD(P)-dependent dehydrogenase (short-subunit alcohol dehydrogenase family)
MDIYAPNRKIIIERLKGKKTLITGGASGIGAAISECFLNEGARVIVLVRSPDKLEEIRKKFPVCEDDGWQVDLDELKQAVMPHAQDTKKLEVIGGGLA